MIKTLKNMFCGRLSRRNYILGLILELLPFLLIFFAYWVLKIIEVVLGVNLLTSGYISNLFIIVGVLAIIFVGIVNLSLVVRRHHDFNQNWYYPILTILIIVILRFIGSSVAELVGGLYTLCLLVVKGNKDKNRFGNEDSAKGWKSILGGKEQTN